MKSLKTLLLVGCGALLLPGSCYSPDIGDGALRCGGPAANECPSGFRCLADGLCHKEGTTLTGGTGGRGGTGTGGMAAGGTGGTGTGGMGGASVMCEMPYGPFTGCTPQRSGSACDPVCQAGCRCGERCNFEGTAALCKSQAGPFRQPYETCEPRADACRPGTICLEEVADACSSHCYKYCRTDADCGMLNARCTLEVQLGTSNTSYKVCSPPVEPCSPVGMARCGNQGTRPFPTFGCYVLSAKFPDLAVCDCAGNVAMGQACKFEHECAPGLECVSVSGQAQCRRVCALMGGLGCPVGQTCTPFTSGGVNSTRFGYCR